MVLWRRFLIPAVVEDRPYNLIYEEDGVHGEWWGFGDGEIGIK
jgi:hypothetical protein